MNDIVERQEQSVAVSQPADLLQIALEKGASVDQLERLMDMKDRHEANEARKAYVQAMSVFRSKCPVIAKTRMAHNSKYAGLAETIEQIKSLLSECGLSHSWKTEQRDHAISVTCCVTHVLGHQECTTMEAPPDDSGKKNRIQAIASTVSYLERYTLYAILGLASAEMDDDGGLAYGNVEYITEEQIAEIESLADEVGTKTSAICSFYGVKHLGVFPAKHYADAIKKLEAKRKEDE